MKKIRYFMEYFTKKIPLKNNFKDYNLYWQNRGFHAPSLIRAKIIGKHIEKNKTILDIGCGDGTMIEYLSNNNQPTSIEGIDISDFAVDYVKSKGFKANIIDIMSIDFENYLKNNKFDYIIITEVIEHIQDPEKILEIIKRLSPNSSLFISIPNSGFIMHRLRLLFGQFPIVMINEHIKEHIRFWTHSDFKYWSDYMGYKIIDFYVSDTIKIFGFELGKISASLFGNQIIYKLKLKSNEY